MASVLAVAPLVTNPCQPDAWLCQKVFDKTHNDWFALAAEWLLAKPIGVLGLLIAGFVARWLTHRVIDRVTTRAAKVSSERNAQRAETLASVLRSVASFIVFGLVVIMAVGVIGYNVAPLVAGASIVGVALGLGAQSIVKDFLYGLFMFFEDQLGVGDRVEIDDVSGTVEALSLRVTRVRADDGTVWYLRNGDIGKVGNRSQR